MLQNILLVADSIAIAQKMAAGEETISIWNLLFTTEGGTIWITIPLLLMSVVIVYIFIDRYIATGKAAKEDMNFMNNIRSFIHDGRLDSAITMCKTTPTPMARMIEKGLLRLGKPLSDINESISNVGQMEISRLEKGMGTISTFSAIAPMLGFLGTVIGMIVAFHEMANAGNNLEISDLAGGIYTALITTVTGLIVGIVGYVCYNVLVSRITRVAGLLEQRASEFMDLLYEPAK
ncbi:MAG: MotA/TolQ/ExbB proton channel family protein [Bacteroidales bacterium]|jgi:biopolymer transport protein ExbB|nr:MotA/TolQ/ExbB proton channel family protein [Bacteroidales bacterium]